ncbi:MAG: prepilin-type N-terminal cleavage/methylation domain-containing protein [Firmicutes bacterium]|nr:prepilin-type N-terminal cleavage/methylation domain-containing protein [Bacillota bacterium]
MKKKNGYRGFTLIEVVVVVAIVAILAAVSIPIFSGYVESAMDTKLISSTKNLSTYLTTEMLVEGFDDQHIFTYVKSSSGSADYFSRHLESNWEILNGPGDSDNSNILGYVNNKSGKVGVVNWSSNLGDGLYSQQALYITTDKGASYTPGATKTINSYYQGSIVIWYNGTNASKIYLYYVTSNGKQSDKYYVYTKGVPR